MDSSEPIFVVIDMKSTDETTSQGHKLYYNLSHEQSDPLAVFDHKYDLKQCNDESKHSVDLFTDTEHFHSVKTEPKEEYFDLKTSIEVKLEEEMKVENIEYGNYTSHVSNCAKDIKFEQKRDKAENISSYDERTKPVTKYTHINERLYVCGVCNKSFTDSSNFVRHKRTHTGERPYVCDVCSKGFTRLTHLTSHKRIHTGNKPYSTVSNNKDLKMVKTAPPLAGCDIEQLHKASDAVRIKIKPKEEDVGHVDHFHSDIKIEELHIKEENMNDEIDSSSHTENIDRVNKDLEKKQKQDNIATHTGQRSYACDVCNKSFSYSSHLSNHKRTHTGETPYECDVCYKKFNQSSNLKRHKQIHTGERPHVCDVCNKGYIRSSDLITHKLMHTHKRKTYLKGKRKKNNTGNVSSQNEPVNTSQGPQPPPYICDVCNKGFTRSTHLSSHQRLHMEKESYVCDVCNKKFVQPSSLFRHRSTHTGLRPYICDICNKRFNDASNLIRHKRIHAHRITCV